jgi:hypothetical protein
MASEKNVTLAMNAQGREEGEGKRVKRAGTLW